MTLSPFKNRKYIWILPLLAAVFLAFFVRYGYIEANDSWAFIEGNLRVSPLYAMVVRFFTGIFGEETGLSLIALLQDLLTAYAIFSLTVCLSGRFDMPPVFTVLLSLVFVAAYLLRLVMVGKESLYCNTILSEGLTFPFYFLFLKYLFFAWDNKSFKYLLTATILCFVLSSTRGQLTNTFISVIVIFFILLKHRTERKGYLLRGIITTACFFACLSLLSCTWHWISSGLFTPTTMGKEAVLGGVLYTSRSEDAALLSEGSEEKILYEKSMKQGEKDGLTYLSAPGDPIGAFKHYEASHDTLRDYLCDAVAERYGEDNEDNVHFLVGSFANAVLPTLLKKNIGHYLKNCLVNAFGGIVRSNSIMSNVGAVWSFLVYAVSIGMTVLFGKKEEFEGEKKLILLILLLILVNCIFCSFGVFELSRYVYYNFPCIYMAILIGLFGLISRRSERGKR